VTLAGKTPDEVSVRRFPATIVRGSNPDTGGHFVLPVPGRRRWWCASQTLDIDIDIEHIGVHAHSPAVRPLRAALQRCIPKN
jgi:hypothetical protein